MSEYIFGTFPAQVPCEPRNVKTGDVWVIGGKREQIVRCKDCVRSENGGTLCGFFAGYEPVAGGDEYAEFSASVEPDGFCAWGKAI